MGRYLEKNAKKKAEEGREKKYDGINNIRNLNLLTVNYLQRQAMVNDRQMFEDVTKIIKDIKNIIATETEYAPFFFPPIPTEPYIIPEFYTDLYNSKFMSHVWALSEKYENQFIKNIKENKIQRSKYYNLRILIFIISMRGICGKSYVKEYIDEFYCLGDYKVKNILDDICDKFFNDDIDYCVYHYNKNIIDPEGNYYVSLKMIETVKQLAKIYDSKDIDGKNTIHLESDIKPVEKTIHKKLADVVRMNKNLELIRIFSYKFGSYDAYSLTAYHDIEYYIDRFIYTINLIKLHENKKYKKKIPYMNLYDDCLHISDYFRFLTMNNGTNTTKTYNIYHGKSMKPKSQLNRFIGLLIWDVKYAKKCSTEKAIIAVMNWFCDKYEQYEEFIEELSYETMMRSFNTTKTCIMRGEYLIHNSRTHKYEKPVVKSELLS